jgi:hypothetical protein
VTRPLALLLLGLLQPVPAAAWPGMLVEALNRDARKIVPRSLGRLLFDRETRILEEARRFPTELGLAMATDLSSGTLTPATLEALESHAAEAVDLIRQKRVSDGLVRLGSTLRIAADLADPVLAAGPEGFPPGVVQEYYSFIEANMDKIPVVLEDPQALELERGSLRSYWQGLLDRSRVQAPVIRTEMFQGGRVVDHRRIDYRSPVFGVASLSYSRAATAIAATWLVFWREVRGDLTRQPQPLVVTPRDGASDPLATPTPRPLLQARQP